MLRFYVAFMRRTNGTLNKNAMKDWCNETIRFRNLVGRGEFNKTILWGLKGIF